MKKRLYFTFLLLLTNLMASAYDCQVNGIYYNLDTSGKTAEVTSPRIDYSGRVNIPSSVSYDGTSYSVTSIGEQAFYHCMDLTSVTIPSSVTSIGKKAFYNCFELTSVTIPNSVTSIGEEAFSHCGGLTSVTIPSSVTSIGGYAFSYCLGLTSVTIHNGVTSIGGYAFSECSGLTSITIPSSVTSIGERAFYNCSSLTSVTIPNSVTSIGEKAFYYCSGLTSINVAEGNTTYDSRGGCNAIIETSSNTLIVGCQNTIIPSSVTSIGERAFYNCSSLTSVTIPNGVTSIGKEAFGGCSGLTSVTIPSSVTSIGKEAFGGCYLLTSINVAEGNTTYDSRGGCNAIIETSSNTLIVGCQNTIIPSSVTSIGERAFSSCFGLESVTIPNGVTSIGKEAFSSCRLTSITIPSSVTSIGERAFYHCLRLTSVKIDRTQPLSISGGTFSERGKATLYVPAGSKEAYEAAFYWSQFKEIKESPIYFADTNVKALCVENWDTDGDGELSKDEAAAVTELGEVFKGNEDITSFDELQYFTGLTSIGNYTFYGCINMTSVTIPSSVTSIGDWAFGECTKLSSMEIPDGVASIGSGAYYACLALTSIHIPRSVVSIAEWSALPTSVSSITVDADNPIYDSRNKCNAVIETATNKLVSGCKNTIIPKDVVIIGVTALSGCYELTSIDIPKNITQIERDAFAWSYMLNSVTCHWQEPISFGEHAFDHIGGECTLTIPYGTKAAYIAKGWTEDVFKGGIIEAAPDSSPLNTLAITDVGVCKGKQITIPVNMNNTESITALQFDLTLPAGVSIAKNDQGKYIVEKTGRCADHTLNVSKPGDANVYRVLLYIISVENITGSEGAVLNVTLETSESMAEGEYDVTISNINLTTPDATKITPADVTCKLTVHNSIPGDANGDGSIDVTDIVSIANAILGRPSNSFDAAAADVNGDGSIDVTDIVVIANMILRGNGQSNAKMRGAEDMLDPQ